MLGTLSPEFPDVLCCFAGLGISGLGHLSAIPSGSSQEAIKLSQWGGNQEPQAVFFMLKTRIRPQEEHHLPQWYPFQMSGTHDCAVI